MPQPPTPKKPTAMSVDFLTAALQPRQSLESQLLGDMWYALKNDKAEMATTLAKSIPGILEGIGGSLLTAGQAGINAVAPLVTPQILKKYLPPGIHIPGSYLPAPQTKKEVLDQALHVATFGLGETFDRNKAVAIEGYNPTRKNADGTLVSLEDDAKAELQAGYDTFMDVSGLRQFGRGISNNYPAAAKRPTSGERLADVVGGGLGSIATIVGLKSLVGGKLPGVSLAEKQAAERLAASKKVKTANDIGTELGLNDGTRIVEAARGDITLEELVTAQNSAKIKEFQERTGVASGATLATGLSTGSTLVSKLGGQSSKIIDNRIINDMGVSMKMLDGTEMFIDTVDATSDLSRRLQDTQISQAMLSVPELEEIVLKARRSEILQQLTAKNPGMLDNHLIAASVANGVLDAEYITTLAGRMGVPADVATQQLVNHLAHTATVASKTMATYNLGAGAITAFRDMQAWFGEQRATDILSKMTALGNKPILEDVKNIMGTLQDVASSMVAKQKKALKSMAANPLTGTAKGWLMNISKLSTSSMLGYIGTPLRNFENALGMAAGIAGFEEFLVDAASEIGGSKVGALGANYGAAARRNVLANLTFDFAKMFMGRGELARGMSALVDAVPTTSKYLRGSGSQLLGHLAELSSTGMAIGDTIMNAYSSMLQTVNNFGVMPLRQAIHGARTIKNIEAIKHWNQIVAAIPETNSPLGRMEFAQEWATNPKGLGAKYGLTEAQIVDIDSEMRLVMADSKIHTLKQEMGFATEGVQAFVDYYHSVPFADALGVAFPKMIYNTWRWTMEHNPANLFSILDDGVRERIMAGAEGGFQTRAAQRDFAKAVSGAATLGLAYGIRSGAFKPMGIEPGSRAHEVKTGQTTTDFRMFSPFDKSLTIAEIMHNVVGKGMSLEEALSQHTAAELADLAIGQRRMGDVPLFGLEKFFQDITTGDEDRTTERLKKLAGDFIGRFSVPMRNAKLITDLMYPEDQYQPDFNKHPMVGPTISHLPGPLADKLGSKFKLDPRIDATTGGAVGANPKRPELILAIAGFKTNELPGLTETLREVNFPLYLLTGNNGDERIDRAVGMKMGKRLQQPIAHDPGNGGAVVTMPLGEYIAGPMMDIMAQADSGGKITDPVYRNSQKVEKLKQVFSDYRVQALAEAYADYPQLFVESKVMASPDFTSDQKKALMVELGRLGVLDSVSKQTSKK